MNKELKDEIQALINEKQLSDIKVKLEIYEMSKPWYKKPDYLKILVPLFVGLLTVVIAFLNGFFSAKASELKASELYLSIRSKEVDTKIDSLNIAYEQFEEDIFKEKNSLLTRNKQILDSLNDLSISYSGLLKKYRDLNNDFNSSKNNSRILQQRIQEALSANNQVQKEVSKSQKIIKEAIPNYSQENGTIIDDKQTYGIPVGYYGSKSSSVNQFLSTIEAPKSISVKRFCRINEINIDEFREDNPGIGSRLIQNTQYKTRVVKVVWQY